MEQKDAAPLANTELVHEKPPFTEKKVERLPTEPLTARSCSVAPAVVEICAPPLKICPLASVVKVALSNVH